MTASLAILMILGSFAVGITLFIALCAGARVKADMFYGDKQVTRGEVK